MSEVQSLVYAINKFLRSEISEGRLPEEKVEGVEICIQCLEAAYEVGPSEPELDVHFALQDVFQKYLSENESFTEPSEEDKATADSLKNEGNSKMDSHAFEEAVVSYTKALKLDPTNPKYYCNRAAAMNNLGDFEHAIRDCESALRYDPMYSKAYYRLGLAHAKLHDQNLREAVRSYRRAVELEPDNERYKESLREAESVLKSRVGGSRLYGLNDQAASTVINMAMEMAEDPVLDSLVSSLVRGLEGGDETVGREMLDLARHARGEIGRTPNTTTNQENSEPPNS